jgi:DNA-binding transcriptional LysR family regulator
LNVITWREEPMVLAVHPSHRFAGRERIPVVELEGEPFIAFDSDLSIRRAVDRFLRRHSVAVDVVMGFDNIENIKRAVEIPSGVSILPEPSLAQEIKAGSLAAIRIEGQDQEDQLTRPLAIIHRKHANLDVAASKFLQLLLSSDVTIDPDSPTELGHPVPAGTSG